MCPRLKLEGNRKVQLRRLKKEQLRPNTVYRTILSRTIQIYTQGSQYLGELFLCPLPTSCTAQDKPYINCNNTKTLRTYLQTIFGLFSFNANIKKSFIEFRQSLYGPIIIPQFQNIVACTIKDPILLSTYFNSIKADAMICSFIKSAPKKHLTEKTKNSKNLINYPCRRQNVIRTKSLSRNQQFLSLTILYYSQEWNGHT